MPSTATSILDGLSTSVAVKAPCRTVATSNITLSGLQTISGYTTVEGDRVLVKGQTDAEDNGIYVASTGSWTRAKDADGNRDLVQGTRVLVRSTTIDGVEYELTTANPIVIGTTELVFTLRYGANALYAQTEPEIDAGVTPTNYSYPPGHAFRYFSTTQVNDVINEAIALDLTSALQTWVNCGHSDLYAPNGKYRVDGTVIIENTGLTLAGESDYNTEFVANGSAHWLQIGDSAYTEIEHVTIKNITHIAGASFSGVCLIRTKQGFQTYFTRVRYKRTLNHPSRTIYLLDNNSGESELPVRVTFRDCYVDAANYAVGAPAVPCPCSFWIPCGIQVVFDNTHIQDSEIGVKIGYDPATEAAEFAGSNDDAYDISFINNSRYQVGDRGDTTTFARAFDVWKGGHLVIDNAQIYLNNNAPNPALASQRIVKFNDDWTDFVMTNTEVNFNARAEHAIEVAATGDVNRIFMDGNNFGAQVASKQLVLVQPGGVARTVIGAGNNYTNPNSYGPRRVITNAGSSTLDLGQSTAISLVFSDGAARDIATLSNAVPGVEYIVDVSLSGGSTLTIATVVPETASGIVEKCGRAGNFKLEDGDLIKIRRSANLAVEKFYIDVIGPPRVETIASAATLTLPPRADVIKVTGTTTVTSVSASGQNGRRATLIFAGILTFTDGSNLVLNGNFVTSGDDTITIVCDGSSWYEESRSAN